MKKVKTFSITEKLIILTMMNGKLKVLKRKDVKYIRGTKLYEGVFKND
jgi:hypothetical protein